MRIPVAFGVLPGVVNHHASLSEGQAVPLKSWSILVADDDARVLDLMQICLTRAGHVVTRASAGNEAFRLVEQQHFDLLITDLSMPDGDGPDLVRRLKQVDAALRIVVVSGGGENFDPRDCVQTAKALGVHAALPKPFFRSQLFDAIHRAMSAGAPNAPV